MRFAQSRRLQNKKEFEYVFSKHEKTKNSEFIFLYRKNSLGYARIGLAISKKKIARACQRNRIKRLLRESFRTAELPALDIVIMARTELSGTENHLIHSHLSDAWQKITASYAG